MPWGEKKHESIVLIFQAKFEAKAFNGFRNTFSKVTPENVDNMNVKIKRLLRLLWKGCLQDILIIFFMNRYLLYFKK